MLKVSEIFKSIQGESSYAGIPCTFVRLSGCNLRCKYCDTRYAYEGGREMSVAEIVKEITRRDTPLIEITGGEPLFQKETPALIDAIVSRFSIDFEDDSGNGSGAFMPRGQKRLLIETSGSISIAGLNPQAIIVMDIKTPSSGSSDFNIYENINFLKPSDEVKFVIGSREDYYFCRDLMKRYNLDKKCTVLLSTVFGAIQAKDVVGWMLDDSITARFQIQMHKYIWSPDTQGV